MVLMIYVCILERWFEGNAAILYYTYALDTSELYGGFEISLKAARSPGFYLESTPPTYLPIIPVQNTSRLPQTG